MGVIESLAVVDKDGRGEDYSIEAMIMIFTITRNMHVGL